MAARRAAPPAPPALTDGDVDLLRQRLGAGEAPRVVTRAASAAVPAGTRGTVVRLGDPASEDEYVVVRIKSDEVPFSPSELSLPGAKAQPVPTAPASRRSSTPRSAASSTSSASSRGGAPATRSPRRPSAGAARSRAASPSTGTPAPTQPTPAGATAATTRSPTAVRAGKAGRASRRRVGRKPAAALTVTLRFDGDGWSAEATRGARRLARPAPLRPGAVGALAEHVDDEALRTALVDTVEACRAVVEDRAARLRAELQDAEAALRDYETRPKRR